MLYLGLVFLLITVVGLIGNTVVIAVIALNSQLHDSTNFLICNLAIADLLFLTCCVPVTAYSYINSWQFSQSVCYGTVTLQYVTCYVSVWTLVLLSVERFLSIRKPQLAKSMKRNRTVLYVCFSIWLLVFALNFPQMQGVGVLTFPYNDTIVMACVDSLSIANENATALGARMFYWGFNLFAYVLPLALSTIFYLLLISKLWVGGATRVESKSSMRMKKHATKMVFIVIVSFGLCWFPQNLRFFLRGLNYPDPTFWEVDNDMLLVVQSTIQVMAYANSCINPILYGALSERFREGMKSTWRRFITCAPCYGDHRRSVMLRCEQSSMRSGISGTRTNKTHDAAINRINKESISPRSSLGVSSATDMTCGSGGRRRPNERYSNEFLPLTSSPLASGNDVSPSNHFTIFSSLSVKRLVVGGTVTRCVDDGDEALSEGDIFL